MEKSGNIIILRDGTDNNFGRHNTNGVKLYQALESSENQKCFYDPGVGTYTPAESSKIFLDQLSFRQLLCKERCGAMCLLSENFSKPVSK